MTERGDGEAPRSADDGSGLSAEARSCLGRWFAGAKNTLVSHEPHATLNKVRGAIDELLAQGFITQERFNLSGSVRFSSTVEGAAIGRAEQERIAFEMGWTKRRALAPSPREDG